MSHSLGETAQVRDRSERARARVWSQFGNSGCVDLATPASLDRLDYVFALVLGMMICLAFALVVVGLVALPARRDGREVLTSRGEELVGAVMDRGSRSS